MELLGRNGTCRALTRSGTLCRMKPIAAGLCMHHDDSETARARRLQASIEAGRASGRARRERAQRAGCLGPIRLRSSGDAIDLIERVINELRRGKLEPVRCRIQIMAARAVLEYADTGEIASRLEGLEESVKGLGLDQPQEWLRWIETTREILGRGRRP